MKTKPSPSKDSPQKFRLTLNWSSERIREKLVTLSEEDHRSQANYLEKLILDAWSARTKAKIDAKLQSASPAFMETPEE